MGKKAQHNHPLTETVWCHCEKPEPKRGIRHQRLGSALCGFVLKGISQCTMEEDGKRRRPADSNPCKLTGSTLRHVAALKAVAQMFVVPRKSAGSARARDEITAHTDLGLRSVVLLYIPLSVFQSELQSHESKTATHESFVADSKLQPPWKMSRPRQSKR